MRTVETKLFSFNELPAKAKEYALSKYSERAEYWNGYEAIKSLQAFVEYFGASLDRYETWKP